MTHIPIRIKQLLGSNVEVILVYSGHLEEKILIESGIDVIKVPVSSSIFFRFKLFLFLRNVVAKEKPDAIMNLNDYKNNWVFWVWGRFNGSRCIARVTGNSWIYKPLSWKGWVRRIGLRAVERVSLIGMHRVICLSQSLAKILPSTVQSSGKVSVLSPGINLNNYKYGLFSSERNIDFLFVGRIEPIKNLKLSFLIFEQIRLIAPSIQFHLVGTGSELEKWKGLYNNDSHVIFYGEKKHADIAPIMMRARFLVLSSYSEGFPNVVLEAMLCGAVPVVTPVSDMPTILSEHDLGILFDPVNPRIAINEIKKLLLDEESRKMVASRANNYVIRKHAYESLRGLYIKALFTNENIKSEFN